MAAAIVQGQGAGQPGYLLRVHAIADSIARGLIPVPFDSDVTLAANQTSEWQRNVSRAFFSFTPVLASFNNFLLLGETVSPPAVHCGSVHTYFYKKAPPTPENREQITLPAVIVGSFRDVDNGSLAHVFINTDDAPANATVQFAQTHAQLQCLHLPVYDGLGSLISSVSLSTTTSARQEKDIDARPAVTITLPAFGVRVVVVA